MGQLEPEDLSSKPVYPEAHSGPLGEGRASYSQPKKYGRGEDINLQSRIIIGAILLCIAGFLVVIYFMTKNN